jgi:hypothetical protein
MCSLSATYSPALNAVNHAVAPAGAESQNALIPLFSPAPPKCVIKVSENVAEREAAFRLVHNVYNRSGLSSPNPLGMRVMKHHLSDSTDILVAKRAGEVVFTSTLVQDAEHGLPLESLFSAELDAMRSERIRLAEVSCLASDLAAESKSAQFEMMVRMISLTLQTARRRGVDRLLLAVHPRHAKIYQRLFGCILCSDVKEYAAVRGNPAVLCMHDFHLLDQARYPLYGQMYNHEYEPWQLDGTRMSPFEKSYFARAVSSVSSHLISISA